ncbi:hypothetical protein [Agrobacterium rosae]|uniref:hypothetical protein n=1 Tax=Agrobacterium rosae TaxID=1972867 RepID=UPI003A805F6F
MSVHVFTSCSYSYLNRARVLGYSLKRFHPDWVLSIVMTDKEPDGYEFELGDEPFDIIIKDYELFGEETNRWLFGLDIVEACTAVKGRACTYIFERYGCEKLFYFDPDIAIFNDLSVLDAALDKNSIILTPHQTEPEMRGDVQAIIDNEITSLHYGSFNLGFVGIKNDDTGRRFCQWWDDRLLDWCIDDLSRGLFVDQKWCNLVPCFFDNVGIIRDPGMNVASWNLSHRVMTFDDTGKALINGHPLCFFHFTKLGAVGDAMTRRYAESNLEIYELWSWYRMQVEELTVPSIPKRWWYYGRFENGLPISKSIKVFYRNRYDLKSKFPQPFEVGDDSFFNWLESETDLIETGADFGFTPV